MTHDITTAEVVDRLTLLAPKLSVHHLGGGDIVRDDPDFRLHCKFFYFVRYTEHDEL